MPRPRPQALLLLLTPLVLVLVGYAAARNPVTPPAEVQSSAPGTPTAPPSLCTLGLRKWARPDQLVLGQTSDVTMVVTGTCLSRQVPIDIVVVADESNSMNRRSIDGPVMTLPPDPITPDPSEPPPTPTPGGPDGPGEGEGEPPFCSGGGVHLLTPTATRTPRWVWRTPTPGRDEPEPTPVQEFAGKEDQCREVKSWVRDFAGDPRIEAAFGSGALRAGFVAFSRRARIRRGLSGDAGDLTSSAGRINCGDITRINEGLREAENILADGSDRDAMGRVKMIILLSDFQFCQKDMKKTSPDTIVICAGFGVRDYDRAKMYQMASRREYVIEKHSAREVVDAVLAAGGAGAPVNVAGLTIRDEVSPDLSLLADSIQPPGATLNGQTITWQLAPPTLPLTLTYRVEPLVDGRLPVSVSADASWTDSVGLVGSAPFPPVELSVMAHTPTPTDTPTNTPTNTATHTPTATATHTSTATPTPGNSYLPILYKRYPTPSVTPVPTKPPCVPGIQTVDVALVIDTSDSMHQTTRPGGPQKLQAAVEAASALAASLKALDQVAVVGFNHEATLLTGLTSDKAAVQDALRRLDSTSASGTAIDRGLRAAVDALLGPAHRPNNHQAIVLLTDGRQTDPAGVQGVRDQAARAKAAGIKVVTIGLGSDIDTVLLTEVASSPALFHAAPQADDLGTIYHQIAEEIPCP